MQRHYLTSLGATTLEPLHPGFVIKAWLGGRNISIEEFANRSELSFAEAQRIITGEKPIDDHSLQKMVAVFGSDIDLIESAKYRFEYYQKYKRRPEYIPNV